MQATRAGRSFHLDMPFGRRTFTMKNEAACSEWYEAIRPCLSKWEIGHFYEVAVGNRDSTFTLIADHRATGTRTILRQIRWQLDPYRNSFEYAMMECEVYASLGHPNVRAASDILVSHDTAYVVIPLAHGTIDELNFAWNEKPVEEVRELARQLLAGAAALHEAGYIHHDMKSCHVHYVRKKDGTIRYMHAGLGAIERMDSDGVVPWKCYVVTDPCYAAPEMKGVINYIKRTGTTGKVDVFSIGCILGEYISNLQMNGKGAYKRLLKSRHEFDKRFKVWDTADESMKQFVMTLLQPDAEKRPTASQALRHPWLQ